MNDIDDDEAGDVTGVLDSDEHDRLRAALRALPDATPRRDVWHRIEAQARAEGLLGSRRPLRRFQWLAGAGVAAAVTLMVLRLPPFGGEVPQERPFPTEPGYAENESVRNLEALMVRSRLLERNLRALPAEPRVMRAATAATISELEDRIAAIDYALNDPDADLSAAEAEVFWRERVRLMDSLVQVRYAHAQRVSF